MLYRSTRGSAEAVSSAYAIKNGIAKDGGLYMPESIPQITNEFIRSICKMSYPERAAEVLSLFLDDYTKEELTEDCKNAYADNFTGGIAPIAYVNENTRVLELWHGPTCAFKDMALQIMPRLLSRALVKTGETREALILVATSGDTGKAALEGYKDVKGTSIMVFYPVDGVSSAQKRQMATQEGTNVNVCAIRGNFDDAQSGVKKIFSDAEFEKQLSNKGVFLSSANSINWGRLAPQIVYYISAYCDLLAKGDINEGQIIDVCVPTGNFGNILAAYIAKKMGLPIGKLVCASNSNNVLTDFIKSGTYNKNRKFLTTVSPSMDILISSNLERLLYVLAGAEKCAYYMKALSEKGCYTVDPETLIKIQNDFEGYYCSEDDCLKTISRYFDSFNYLADTHTAVALHCADSRKNRAPRTLVDSTASPYKFAAAVADALGLSNKGEDPDIFARISEHTNTEIPAPLISVFEKDIRFTKTVDADKMKEAVSEFVGL